MLPPFGTAILSAMVMDQIDHLRTELGVPLGKLERRSAKARKRRGWIAVHRTGELSGRERFGLAFQRMGELENTGTADIPCVAFIVARSFSNSALSRRCHSVVTKRLYSHHKSDCTAVQKGVFGE